MDSTGVRSSTLEAIGGTPLVRRRRVVQPDAAKGLVKIAGGHPSGSHPEELIQLLATMFPEVGEASKPRRRRGPDRPNHRPSRFPRAWGVRRGDRA